MYSLSLFSHASFLNKFHRGNEIHQFWILFKSGLYKMIIKFAIFRILTVTFLLINKLPLELLQYYDPFGYMLHSEIFENNVYMTLSMIALLIFALVIENTTIFALSKYCQLLFKDFAIIQNKLQERKYFVWRKVKNFSEIIRNTKVGIGIFLTNRRRISLIVLILNINHYVTIFLITYRKLCSD